MVREKLIIFPAGKKTFYQKNLCFTFQSAVLNIYQGIWKYSLLQWRWRLLACNKTIILQGANVKILLQSKDLTRLQYLAVLCFSRLWFQFILSGKHWFQRDRVLKIISRTKYCLTFYFAYCGCSEKTNPPTAL